MVDSLKYHKRYPRFLTPEECKEIISVIERDKDIVPRGTYEETGYHGLTQTYDRYNWLHNPSLQHLEIEQRLFTLPEFQDWKYMITQCWGNALHIGEDLGRHYHGSQVPDDIRRDTFYSANIFLAGEDNITWYEDWGDVSNHVGDVHVFSCSLEHEVYTNKGSDTRYSLAIDIYDEMRDNMHNTYRWRVSKHA